MQKSIKFHAKSYKLKESNKVPSSIPYMIYCQQYNSLMIWQLKDCGKVFLLKLLQNTKNSILGGFFEKS